MKELTLARQHHQKRCVQPYDSTLNVRIFLHHPVSASTPLCQRGKRWEEERDLGQKSANWVPLARSQINCAHILQIELDGKLKGNVGLPFG